MMRWLRTLLVLLVARPVANMLTGADVSGREHLPLKGPAIVVANHASHMDTLLLLTIFPARAVPRVRPVAAAEYFLRDPLLSWFSRNLVGIVPIARGRGSKTEDVLAPARAALAAGDIVVVFPEGSRNETDTDEMGRLKSGVARLAEAFPEAPVTPIWIQGAGRVLPKGETLPVPLNCAVLVGPPLAWGGERAAFMAELREALLALKAEAPPLRWS